MLWGSTSKSTHANSEERFARYTTFILVILVSDFATTSVRLDQKDGLTYLQAVEGSDPASSPLALDPDPGSSEQRPQKHARPACAG